MEPIDARLMRILQCPYCSAGGLQQQAASLLCLSCRKRYDIVDGIPDMRVYESNSYRNDSNRIQAAYEAKLHDIEAQEWYEERVVRMYGTKTRLIVQAWGGAIAEASDPVVLDYGCGTGQVSRVLKNHVAPLFAFDISMASVRKNVQDNGVVGISANSFFLPFKDKTFDMLFINGVLHHIVDLDRAIKEIARITRGPVYVSEGVPRGKPSMARALAYPCISQKMLYFFYLLTRFAWRCAHFPWRCARFVGRRLRKKARGEKGSCSVSGSKYERPLDVEQVATAFGRQGFQCTRRRFFTNVDIPGDGLVKRLLTKWLVNETVGTHFDIRLIASALLMPPVAGDRSCRPVASDHTYPMGPGFE